jgi:signal transduction histidine kinase
MFSSLRSRLWMTYVLLAGGVLCIVAAGLVVFILRNPSQTRQAYQRVVVIATLFQNRELVVENATQAQLNQGLQHADQVFGARLILLSPDGTVEEDTRSATAGAFPQIPLPGENQTQIRFQVRDAQRKLWIYAVRPLQQGGWVVAAVQAPRFALLQALRDDLVPPMIEAGLIALVAAILLAFWITSWIAAPLQRIAKAAHGVARGDYQPIQVKGPSEVQELGQAFNNMAWQVQSSQKSQRDFVANVSHELKTPLTSIQGFAQAIVDGAASTPEALQQAGTIILSEANRMHRLVLDLLDLARLDSGTANLDHSPLDIASLVKGVVDRMTPQARQAEVSLECEVLTVPPVLGDADRISQVFTNLVDNAIKYTPPGKPVIIRAGPVDGKAQVSFSDSGEGISPEDLPHIFERFYQADKSRRGGSQRGAGLGLAIAHEIVLAHSGTIEVASLPGQGSTFVVKIPLALPDSASQPRKRK